MRDGVVPAAFVERANADVVQHRRLAVQQAELLEDRQRPVEEVAGRAAAVALGGGADVVGVRERLAVSERRRRLRRRLGRVGRVVDPTLPVEDDRATEPQQDSLGRLRVRDRAVVERERVVVAPLALGDDTALPRHARRAARHARSARAKAASASS